MAEEIEPHIYRKYEFMQRLGKGAYGIVWKAVERKTKQVVAVKKVFDAFHNDTDAQRTFREVMILQELDHENMIKLYNVIKAENNKDIYLIFEYMETDLHAVIRSEILKDIHKVYIVYQILNSLLYLHSAQIIHRDLKPSNILINSECLVKLADFGLARSALPYDENTAPVMTEYVATRWYRAPEIVLGSSHYSKAVDMWSVGCILGELIIGKALFPGKSTINQIELILDLLGKPKPEDLEEIGGSNEFNSINFNSKQKYTFSSFFKGASKDALDFLKRSLEFNPKKRITVEEALAHPFVKHVRSPATEIKSPKIIQIPISDQKKLTVKEYREALYADIIQKKKEQRKKWQINYLKQLGINVTEDQNMEVMQTKVVNKQSSNTLQQGHSSTLPAQKSSTLGQQPVSKEAKPVSNPSHYEPKPDLPPHMKNGTTYKAPTKDESSLKDGQAHPVQKAKTTGGGLSSNGASGLQAGKSNMVYHPYIHNMMKDKT